MKVKLKFFILWNLKLSKQKRRDLPKKKNWLKRAKDYRFKIKIIAVNFLTYHTNNLNKNINLSSPFSIKFKKIVNGSKTSARRNGSFLSLSPNFLISQLEQ